MAARDHRILAFSLRYETDVLALLLQRPELFDDYPDIWTTDNFADHDLKTIMRAWLRIRGAGCRAPSLASMENELLVKWGVSSEKTLPGAETGTLERLRQLYSYLPPDPQYIVAEVLIWQKQLRMTKSIEEAVDLFNANKPEEIPNVILEALNVGRKSSLAGDDFYNTPPNIPDAVFPGVLQVESIGLLLGASKSYKTWNLLNAGIASAMGQSWMGFMECKKKRTLYCNMELHEEQLKARLDWICSRYGITRSQLKGNLDFLNLKGRANGIESVLLDIRNHSRRQDNPYRLIIVDPIYKLYASADMNDGKNSENDVATIGALFEKLERLAWELHSALLLAHHFKKGSSAETAMIDIGSGSGAFGRGPDALIALRPLEEEDTWRCESVIRYFPRMEPFGLRLDFPCLVRDNTLDISEIKDRPGAKKEYRVEEILKLLPEEGLINKEWREKSKEKVGCSDGTYCTLRDEAVDRGLAREEQADGRQIHYFLTEAGKRKINAPKLSVLQAKIRNNGRPGFTRIGGDQGGSGQS